MDIGGVWGSALTWACHLLPGDRGREEPGREVPTLSPWPPGQSNVCHPAPQGLRVPRKGDLVNTGHLTRSEPADAVLSGVTSELPPEETSAWPGQPCPFCLGEGAQAGSRGGPEGLGSGLSLRSSQAQHGSGLEPPWTSSLQGLCENPPDGGQTNFNKLQHRVATGSPRAPLPAGSKGDWVRSWSWMGSGLKRVCMQIRSQVVAKELEG